MTKRLLDFSFDPNGSNWEYDFSDISDLLGLFNKRDGRKIEEEMARRDERDESLSLEPLTRKQILKIDFKKRQIFRYSRWVDGYNRIVARTKEIFYLPATGALDKEDRARVLLLGGEGLRFAYLKTQKGFVPAIVFDNGEFVALPKDFANRVSLTPPPLPKPRKHSGSRLLINRPLNRPLPESSDVRWKKKEVRFKEKFSMGT